MKQGLISTGEVESEDQKAQMLEEILKKKREKLAGTRLGISFEEEVEN